MKFVLLVHDVDFIIKIVNREISSVGRNGSNGSNGSNGGIGCLLSCFIIVSLFA
jgi:hypothetical protein